MLFMRKFGVRSLKVKNVISEISKYLSTIESTKESNVIQRYKVVYLLDSDSIKSVAHNPTIFKTLLLHLTVTIQNLVELGKVIIKRRRKNLRKLMYATGVPIGELYGNLRNGTYIVLHENTVRKFYFHDIDYFDYIYSLMLSLEKIDVYRKEHFLCVTMERYRDISSKYKSKYYIDAYLRNISKIDRRYKHELKHEKYLHPSYKIEQLFANYNQQNGAYLSKYEMLSRHLFDQVPTCDLQFCHGDLWLGNFLENKLGELVLIDFDKALIYSKFYDIVYFYLMNLLSIKYHNDLHLLQKDFDGCVGIIVTEIKIDCSLKVTLKEVRQCVLLVVLFKLTEYALWHKNFEENLQILKSLIYD